LDRIVFAASLEGGARDGGGGVCGVFGRDGYDALFGRYGDGEVRADAGGEEWEFASGWRVGVGFVDARSGVGDAWIRVGGVWIFDYYSVSFRVGGKGEGRFTGSGHCYGIGDWVFGFYCGAAGDWVFVAGDDVAWGVVGGDGLLFGVGGVVEGNEGVRGA
jgi:hypothetical protein